MSDQRCWLGFSLVSGIGTKRIDQLIRHFHTLEAAWNAPESELLRAGLDKKTAANVLAARSKIDLDAEMVKVRKAGAWLLTLADEHYPTHLKVLPDAPIVLYIRGSFTDADNFALSIVGTRSATKYGRDVAYDFAKQISKQGITIISGMAHGIDSAAHRGALDSGQRTIAVMGCGIDTIYPRENAELARQIVENGAIISEFPVGTHPDKRNFPRRNRIISGLGLGVLIVEAPENSGAMITASAALDQGREVFAVPGNIYSPASWGTHRLIQDGAKLVMGVGDILDELNIAHNTAQTRIKTQAIVPTNPVEAAVLGHLSAEPIHVDELARLTNLPAAAVSSTLLVLELKGLVQQMGPMRYSLDLRQG